VRQTEARSMWIGAGNLFDQMARGLARLIERAASGDPQAVLLVIVVLGTAMAIGVRLMRVKGMP
jgi:hypothetical protein